MSLSNSLKERTFGIVALIIVALAAAYCISQLTISVGGGVSMKMATDGQYYLYHDGEYVANTQGFHGHDDHLLAYNSLVYGTTGAGTQTAYVAIDACTGNSFITDNDGDFASHLDSLQVPASDRDFANGKDAKALKSDGFGIECA